MVDGIPVESLVAVVVLGFGRNLDRLGVGTIQDLANLLIRCTTAALAGVRDRADCSVGADDPRRSH